MKKSAFLLSVGIVTIQEVQMLHTDMAYMKQLHDNLIKQKNIQEEDLRIAKEIYDADNSLNNDKVISPLEYRNEKGKYIGKALNIPQISSVIISNESMQHDKLKEIAELENDIFQQKNIFI